jgi:hypothetical protein
MFYKSVPINFFKKKENLVFVNNLHVFPAYSLYCTFHDHRKGMLRMESIIIVLQVNEMVKFCIH